MNQFQAVIFAAEYIRQQRESALAIELCTNKNQEDMFKTLYKIESVLSKKKLIHP